MCSWLFRVISYLWQPCSWIYLMCTLAENLWFPGTYIVMCHNQWRTRVFESVWYSDVFANFSPWVGGVHLSGSVIGVWYCSNLTKGSEADLRWYVLEISMGGVRKGGNICNTCFSNVWELVQKLMTNLSVVQFFCRTVLSGIGMDSGMSLDGYPGDRWLCG